MIEKSFFGSAFLLIAAGSIYVIGLVMVFSASSAEVLDHDLSRSMTQALFWQLTYTAIGILLAVAAQRIGIQRFLAISPLLYGMGVVLLLLVLVPGIGREVNGSRRWLSLAGFSFQPSEFVKLSLPLFFIREGISLRKRNFPLRATLQLAVYSLLPVLCVLIEPNNGTAAVMGVTLLLLCWLLRIPFRYWAVPLLVVGLIGGVAATQLPYVKGRLHAYFHPEEDLLGKGHQPYQAKIAAGSGGLWGKGPGKSWQKLSFLPEAQNDYIGAIFAEEYGFIGMASLLTLYALLIFSAHALTVESVTEGDFIYRASLTFLFAVQTFLNLGVVSGLLPSTGLNLPLFSQGGSSLMANLVALGLLVAK